MLLQCSVLCFTLTLLLKKYWQRNVLYQYLKYMDPYGLVIQIINVIDRLNDD